ncbi:hypothetical protein FRC12_018754 [Ceratobasidium sp. 428]|nr:hypothetical protein FRC12_018754 [Ceratobasidium sp. 428]
MVSAKTSENAFKVTVNVRKDQQDGSILDPPHTVGGWTLASAIEWGVSNIPAVEQELTGKSARFELNGTPVAKDQTIGELAGSEQALTLDMVITSNPVGPMDGVTAGGTTAEAAPTEEAAAAGAADATVSQVTEAQQGRPDFETTLEEYEAFVAKEDQRMAELIAASSASDAPDSGINPDAPEGSGGSGVLSSARKSSGSQGLDPMTLRFIRDHFSFGRRAVPTGGSSAGGGASGGGGTSRVVRRIPISDVLGRRGLSAADHP